MGLSMILTCSPTTTWTVTPGHSQIISHWDHPPRPGRAASGRFVEERPSARTGGLCEEGGGSGCDLVLGEPWPQRHSSRSTVPRENHPLNPVPKQPVIDQ